MIIDKHYKNITLYLYFILLSCQISAFHRGKLFNVYMVPMDEIGPGATRVNGLSTDAGELFLHGQLVDTTPVQKALRRFLNFLESCAPTRNSCVVLAAHNGPR